MRLVKRLVVRALTLPLVSASFAPLLRGRAVVFMLHRFRDPSRGIAGQDPAVLRAGLAWLRQHHFDLVSLEDLLHRLLDGGAVRRAVAFTIDDGYIDQAAVAAPVFAEYDCPVTTFLASGFLDRTLWFWWDRIEYVFTHTTATRLRAHLGDAIVDYALPDAAARRAAQIDFTARCKEVRTEVKESAIPTLAEEAGVILPATAPAPYAPMSWDDARACERRGMSFGPHTVTHPILSRTGDARAARELEDSWRRLKEEVSRPVPVFCYPNGRWEDFSSREVGVLRRLDFLGAVTGAFGYAAAAPATAGGEWPFRLRRFAYPDTLPDAIQYLSGFERLKEIIRGEAA